MRALVYSDLQATDGHEKCHSEPTIPLQIARVNAIYRVLLEIYDKYGCDCLWDLGDTTDDRSSIPVPAIDIVCGSLAKFNKSEWDIKLIGNHEQFLRNTQVHVGNMFSPYFTVVGKNQAFNTDQGVVVLACPYPADERETVAWLQTQRKAAKAAGDKVILLGHFQVVGSISGAGQLLTGIPKNEIAWVDLGLLGHVHKPQTIHGNVHYVGSPFQQDWGETGESKRVGIVDILKGTVEWVAVVGFPQYRKVSLNDFQKLCTPESEDRFKVVLQSQAEASEFYALPLANRAEPVYNFDVTSSETDTSSTGDLDPQSWEFDNVMARYVEKNTPESRGIPATVPEMLELGHDIALE